MQYINIRKTAFKNFFFLLNFSHNVSRSPSSKHSHIYLFILVDFILLCFVPVANFIWYHVCFFLHLYLSKISTYLYMLPSSNTNAWGYWLTLKYIIAQPNNIKTHIVCIVALLLNIFVSLHIYQLQPLKLKGLKTQNKISRIQKKKIVSNT